VPKNEDGEFELILGNRQLLSVFFIVVILLGVFFTMGYIVGRNSTPVSPTTASAQPGETKPLVVESTSTRQPETPPPTTPPSSTASQQPASETPALRETAKSEPAEPARRTQEKAETAKPKPEKRFAPEEGPSGTYLQLAATSRREAEIMVDVLRTKRFKATSAEVPEKPGLFRVLVGPLADSAVNKMRADLQGAGFPGNSAIKRTF
jgi:cell division septation protein DedD